MELWNKNFKDQYTLIELTDCCNLKCPMCSHNRPGGPHGDSTGFMDLELFKKIINELESKESPNALKLFWLGESLLHPQIDEILIFLYEKIKNLSSLEYIDIHTNGLMMTPEIADLLIDLNTKLPRLTLSIDAAGQDTYSKVRVGGDYQKLMTNIEYLLRSRVKKGQIFPSLILQFIVMGVNSFETEKFVYNWIDILNDLKKDLPDSFFHSNIQDTIWIKREDVSPKYREHSEKLYNDTINRFNLKSVIEKNYELIVSVTNLWDEPEKVSKKIRFPCSGPFKTPCIKWDGELTVCCFDPTFELSLGNLNNHSFNDLWFSPKADYIRYEMIRGNFSNIKNAANWDKCFNCSGLDTPKLEPGEIIHFLENHDNKQEHRSMVLDFLERLEGDSL